MEADICTATEAAWNDFFNNHAAYLQAIICVLEAEKHAREVEGPMRDALLVLNKHAKVIGLDSIEYFKANLFSSQITGIELFFQRVVKAVIRAYPKKIGQAQFRLNQITDAASIDELVEQATDEYLNRLMYKKPLDYLTNICKTLSIDRTKLEPLWPNFIEAKARRDVGVHNNWICNDTYLRKVQEAGLQPTVKRGESLVPSNNKYIFQATDRLSDIAKAVLLEVVAKYSSSGSSGDTIPNH